MKKPSKIILEKKPPALEHADFKSGYIKDKRTYLKELKKYQILLQHIQQAYYNQSRRAVIVFEGWDASGKGGAIRRVTEKLDPRGFQVVPIAAPTREEQGRHYLYRFFNELPEKGTMTLFDRSYFGRVLVERVEGFASKPEWQRAYHELNEFERLLKDDGVRVIKMFLHITKEEQLKRFEERLHNPYKRWKITEEDLRNREKWNAYEAAINDMFSYTSTVDSPWNLIAADRKWFTRIEVLKILTGKLSEGVDIEPDPLTPEMIEAAEQALGIVIKPRRGRKKQIKMQEFD